MRLHDKVKAQAREIAALREGLRRLRGYLTGAKFHDDTNVNVRDVLLRLDEIEGEGTAARDSVPGPGYFAVRYLRRGYGAGLCRVVVFAADADVAKAMVIGSGVAVPGTVRDAEPAELIDAELAGASIDNVYPAGALNP